jgi:hypothetical protein
MESLIWLLGVVISALIGDEILGISYRLSRIIILQAAKNVPNASRERFIEETLAELADIRGPLSRMWNAIDYFWVTSYLRSHNGDPASGHSASEGTTPALISEESEDKSGAKEATLGIVERILAALIILALLVLMIALAWPL